MTMLEYFGSSGTRRKIEVTGVDTASGLKKPKPSSTTHMAGGFVDPEHSDEEERFITVGNEFRSQFNCGHSCKRQSNLITRIISARAASERGQIL